MHACEALLWAFEATGDKRFLERAGVLADNITQRQAALAGGLVWEHYRPDWSVDWDYNRGDPKHLSSEEHTSELQSLMRISYAVFCLKKTKTINHTHKTEHNTNK